MPPGQKAHSSTDTRLVTHIDHFQWIDLCITFVERTPLKVFPGGSVVQSPPFDAGERSSIPDLGRSHRPQSD